ncbi:MAG TPA: (deoxy)nucleoside triphosphate pyrophosphohydrolase [Bryobacteraceae bacterium]|nr:(deoxy)nucleoside triphosphate pyrophosphohydrolase [Bryobacteraceae bacterium]
MLPVVAAILERDGRILICQRRPGQAHPLKWEFPGGKVEPAETPEQALARELEEELGIRSAEGQEITRYEYCYPGRNPILLIFYRVMRFEGEPQNRIFHDMRWEPAAGLGDFDFLEGDTEFIRRLAGQK